MFKVFPFNNYNKIFIFKYLYFKMNFIVPYNNIDKNYFSFIKPVKNRTINNGLFYKLYYNNNLFIINTFMMNIELEYMNEKVIKNNINLQILKF